MNILEGDKKEEVKEQLEEQKRETVIQEKERILQSEKEGVPNDGLRILGIDKVFNIGTCKKKQLHALKKVVLLYYFYRYLWK